MIPKIKKFIKKNRKLLKKVILGIFILIVLIVLYKSFFYSSKEKDIYGVRLRDIEKYKITSDNKKKISSSISSDSSVEDAKMVIKGRLIKFFTTFKADTTQDKMKEVFTSYLDLFSEDEKNYYDFTFYAKQQKEKKMIYPVIGYKHRSKTLITWDVF